ncbi:hypothetical protein [Pyxidicoccus caerfyrddinensis]|uniref:hypothetical protein n=1 Tax=Pyxidicoccus caerfyrddinensis TaxID=2709663 RepID=UPI0013DA6535|nr:hypothetical protein [Pyxidicoccus caerfyrddinensis]
MSRRLLALSSLLLLAAGCRHANLPDLPASHGALSMAMDRYAHDRASSYDNYTPTPASLFEEEPQVIVEPDQALAVFTEAIGTLSGSPTEQQVRLAADDLKAACLSGLPEACAFLRERFEPPRKLNGAVPDFPREVLQRQIFTVGALRCRLGVNGMLRDCKVLESGAEGVAESLLEFTTRGKFQPATLAGHPIDLPYTFQVQFAPARTDAPMGKMLLPEKQLEWARARAAHSPESPLAWGNLAVQLAKRAPEDRWYREALNHFQELAPASWWAANEVAWLHVREGRYADAAPLVKRARAIESDNPYILETFAAVMAGTNQCEQAVHEQRRAVEKLPADWPAPERERFTRALEDYQRGCPKADATPASEPPR